MIRKQKMLKPSKTPCNVDDAKTPLEYRKTYVWKLDIGTLDDFALGMRKNDIRNSKNSVG